MHIRDYLKLAALTALGRNPLCSLTQAWRGYADLLAQSCATERISSECSLLEQSTAELNLWQTPLGSLCVPVNTGRDGLAMILAEQETGAYGLLGRGVQPDDVVLDCGANIGVYSRKALAAGARMVVAIEPTPANLLCLRRNLAAEIAVGRVLIVEKGLWNQEGSLTLFIDPHNSGGNSFITRSPGAHESTVIPVTTIDRLVEELGLERVNFIKMDVEASEQKALEGAQQTLARFRPRLAIAVEHTPDRLGNAREVIARTRKARPDYRVSTGSCYVSRENIILPEMLYFD